jgi:hypothetical protein
MGLAKNSFTIHGGSVDFKGHSYMFYHNGTLPGGGGYKRSTCIEEFTRNEDGSIPFIEFTTKGVNPIQTLNPYALQQAETINQSSGVLCVGDYNGCWVTNIHSGDYIKVRNVDFGSTGAASIKVRVAGEKTGSLIIRLKSQTGTIVGRVRIEPTGGLDQWTEVSSDLTRTITGVQDLYFTFAGSATNTTSIFNFDTWQFGELGSSVEFISRDEGQKTERYYNISGQKLKNIDSAPKKSVIITPKGKIIKK